MRLDVPRGRLLVLKLAIPEESTVPVPSNVAPLKKAHRTGRRLGRCGHYGGGKRDRLSGEGRVGRSQQSGRGNDLRNRRQQHRVRLALRPVGIAGIAGNHLMAAGPKYRPAGGGRSLGLRRQQNGSRGNVRIGHHYVWKSVPVQVAHADSERSGPGGKSELGFERAVAVAQQHTDRCCCRCSRPPGPCFRPR